jgi:hypothetical protein
MHGLISLPIVLEPMLDLFMVLFDFCFHPFFLSPFVFSADRRPFGLISFPFSDSSVARVRDLIAFVDIILAHFHPRSFHLLFLDNFKGFDSNDFKFTGFF